MQYFCCKIYFLFISFGIATYFNFTNYDFRSDLKKFLIYITPTYVRPPPPFQKFLDTPLALRVEIVNVHLTAHLDSLIRCFLRTLCFLVNEGSRIAQIYQNQIYTVYFWYKFGLFVYLVYLLEKYTLKNINFYIIRINNHYFKP